MANSSFVITINTPLSSTEMTSRYLLAASTPRNECMALSGFFKRLADGLSPGAFDCQYSPSAPVRASGTLTLTYASIANNDTCVIGGTTLTCVTGTPSGFTQFKKQTDATVTAANLVAAITGNTTLNKLVTAANVAGVVTITALVPGVIGNQITLVGSTGIVAGAANFVSGAGGAASAKVTYSRG